MLGADLVRATRRGDKLHLTKIKGTERADVEGIARGLLEIIEASLGAPLDEVSEAVAAVPRGSRHEKLWAGLKKLALDSCEFGSELEVDPVELRKTIFELASQRRKAASGEVPFDRQEVVTSVAAQLNAEPQAIEDGLFGDLKGAARLTKASWLSPEGLVERYEVAQIQGVLLRAVRLKVVVECTGPDQARAFFHKLKFRQLLYRLEKLDEKTYEIELEGPFSLFESVTKYGMQLALLVPDLLACRRADLQAELRWGKERKNLKFETTLRGLDGLDRQLPVRTEVSALLDSIAKKKSPWTAEISSDLFDVPGVGLCIPDLKLSAPERPDVFIEVLGFWSRDAVWKRVEWAEQNVGRRVIFAVSSRLRVKKEVLPEETGSALYVYKGVMNAGAILAQADELSEPR